MLDIPRWRAISDTALTREAAIAMGADGLPNTFVPGRNLLFLTFAAALAYRRGLRDSSAACARPIIPAIPIAATTPSRRCRSRSTSAWTDSFEIETPLMWIDKAATWALAQRTRRRRRWSS